MAHIEVTTMVTIIHANGDKSTIGDTQKKSVGDNPLFFANDAEILMLVHAGRLKSQVEHRFGKMPTKIKSTKKKG